MRSRPGEGGPRPGRSDGEKGAGAVGSSNSSLGRGSTSGGGLGSSPKSSADGSGSAGTARGGGGGGGSTGASSARAEDPNATRLAIDRVAQRPSIPGIALRLLTSCLRRALPPSQRADDTRRLLDPKGAGEEQVGDRADR